MSVFKGFVILTALVLTAPLATPLAAQNTFALPAGCTAYVTVQKRSCTISHLFTCQSDPAGHQRRVDLNEDGMTYLGIIDAETQWIESFYPDTSATSTLAPGAVDPSNLTELLATGRDGMDFQTLSDIFGPTRYVGEDRLTGETVVIDGISLLRTSFDIVVTDATGQELWTIKGNEYVHPEWRTFLSGTRSYTSPTDVLEEDGSPVTFIFPGEDGFLGSIPRYDCGVVMSSAPDAHMSEPTPVPVLFERN